LHKASGGSHLFIVQYWIKKRNYEKAALHKASDGGHLEIVQYLIETCQVNMEAKNNDGRTADYFASKDVREYISKVRAQTATMKGIMEDPNPDSLLLSRSSSIPKK
jgi:ankyrin repeat protein